MSLHCGQDETKICIVKQMGQDYIILEKWDLLRCRTNVKRRTTAMHPNVA